MSNLAKANLLVLGLLVLHTIDHGVGQEARELPGSSSLVGVSGFVIIAISSWLALQRSRHAADAAIIVGAVTTLGVAAVHLLPSWWGWVSDPYWDFDASFLSWLSLFALMAAALGLTALGLRERGVRAPHPQPRG